MIKKGQSAMEYLMTYGWAILIIAIIFAILFIYIRPISTPEMCNSKSQIFACEGLRITGTGNIYARITNGYYKTLKITALACTQTGATPTYTNTNIEVGSGGYIKNIWDSSEIKCQGATPGTPYSGVLYIKYREIDAPSSVPDKVAEVIVSTTPQ
ncbi:MAG: hypothetical protein QXV83_03310 [Candidatus Anstonellaceae archaeon]